MKVKIISVLLFIVVMFTMFGCNSVDGIEVDSVSIGGVSEAKSFTYQDIRYFYKAERVGTKFHIHNSYLEWSTFDNSCKLSNKVFDGRLSHSEEIGFLQDVVFNTNPKRFHTSEDYLNLSYGDIRFLFTEHSGFYKNPKNELEYAIFYSDGNDSFVIERLQFESIEVEYKPLKVYFYEDGFTVYYYVIELKDNSIVQEYKKYEYAGDYSYTNEDNNIKIITK